MSKWLYLKHEDFAEEVRGNTFKHFVFNLDRLIDLAMEDCRLRFIISEKFEVDITFKDVETCKKYFKQIQDYLFPELEINLE